jgi:glucokinase
MLLAGDIGGTKTNLAIFSPEQGPHQPLVEATFPSDDYPDLQTLAQAFLAEVEYPVAYASFGVAGPVVDGHVKATNLPWEMDEAELTEALGLEAAFLLNDLESIANAISSLEPADLATLNTGQPEEQGAIAVIAPGTGLGEAYLTWDGQTYHAHPSEGGHTDFGPTSPLQVELLRYWQARKEHISYEWVCSGIGIRNIYEFLRDTQYAPEPDWLAAKLAAAEDKTPLIVSAALNEDVALCRATLDLFVEILGAEAGNLALKILATGGVYLGGGIPPRILPVLQSGALMLAFRRKGRFGDLLNRMPVRVILNPKSALMGAAAYGLERMQAGAQARG